MKKIPRCRLAPRLRVFLKDEIALGPGKAELLGHIAKTGSLTAAARRMEMSYMKAWRLVQVMNRCFRQPLIAASDGAEPLIVLDRGGAKGGGARLTACGAEALALYRAMEEAAAGAMQPAWERLQGILRTDGK